MFGIDDAILGNVAGAALGGLFGGDSQGGTQTASKTPWEPAQPWILDNIKTGQNLQGYYQNTPFNQYQKNAYGQLFGLNNYINGAVPSLLSQFSQPVGYDISNPLARSTPVQFPQMGLLSAGSGSSAPAGLLGDLNVTANPFRNGGIPAPAAAPVPAVDSTATLLQQIAEPNRQGALDAYQAWKGRTGKNLTFDQWANSGVLSSMPGWMGDRENAGPGSGE